MPGQNGFQTDPFAGVRQGISALATVAQINQNDRRLNMLEKADQREQQKTDDERVLLPYKYMQAKMEAMTPYLQRLPKHGYRGFYQAAIKPIDAKTGLGAIPPEMLPSPDEVEQMPEEEWSKTRTRWSMTGKQLAEMQVAEFKNTLDMGLAEKKAKQEEALIGKRGEVYAANDARQAQHIIAQTDLENLRNKNALALEDARYKREVDTAGLKGPGSARDPMKIDLLNRAQKLIDDKRKIMSDMVATRTPEGRKALQDIDNELQGTAARYRQLGYDPADFMGGGGQAQSQPNTENASVYDAQSGKFVPMKDWQGAGQKPSVAGAR